VSPRTTRVMEGMRGGGGIGAAPKWFPRDCPAIGRDQDVQGGKS